MVGVTGGSSNHRRYTCRLSKPVIKPLIIFASTSSSWLRDSQSSSFRRPRRLAISSNGTHSCTAPRAIQKKCLSGRLARGCGKTISFGEAAVTFSQIGRYGEGGAVELVGKESVATGEFLGEGEDEIREIHRLLVDFQFLEHECHLASLGGNQDLSRRTGEQETAGELDVCTIFMPASGLHGFRHLLA